jgi:hypothetical protein
LDVFTCLRERNYQVLSSLPAPGVFHVLNVYNAFADCAVLAHRRSIRLELVPLRQGREIVVGRDLAWSLGQRSVFQVLVDEGSLFQVLVDELIGQRT